jgi:predicted aspartyl protease
MNKVLCVGALASLALLVHAQVTTNVPKPEKPAQATAAADLSSKEKYAEALTIVDQALTATPDNPDLLQQKVVALLGLGRNMEALRIAVPAAGRFTDRPIFRFQAGEAAAAMGMMPEAVRMWSALYANPEWGSLAYAEAAGALLAVGKDDEARKLTDDALAKVPNPSVELLLRFLQTHDTAEEGVKITDRLAQVDPANKADYESLKQLYVTVGSGPLNEVVPPEKLPATISLKEKSEFVDMSGLTWGGGDDSAAVSTSTSVVVPASFNGGKEKLMVLDSGAETVLVSPGLVKELELQPVATAQYIGLGHKGAQKSSWVLIKTLKLGPVTVKNVPAMVIDKKSDFWKDISGIVPMSLLKEFALSYDRRKGRLGLYASGSKPEDAMGAGTFTAKSLWFDGKPYVSTTIQGKPDLWCMLDTGSSKTFIASERVKDLGITVNTSRYDRQQFLGLSGSLQVGVATDVNLSFGTAQFKLPTVHVAPVGSTGMVDTYGLVGRTLLDLFAMWFDYRANTVAFKGYDK